MNPTDVQRLEHLLVDPKTRHAASLAAKRWAEHEDDSKLLQDLEFIQSHIIPAAEVDTARFDAITARVDDLLSIGPHKMYGVVKDVIEARDKQDFDFAEARLDVIEAEVKAIQQGSDNPLPVKWRGEFTPGVLYQPGDLVTYKMSSYIAMSPTSEKPSGVSQVWDLLAGLLSGPMGPPGPPGEPGSSAAGGYGN